MTGSPPSVWGFDAYAAALTKASELTGAFGDKTSAFGRVFGNVWDMVGEKLDKVLTGGSLDERIKDLQAQLEQTESLRGRFGGLLDYRVDAPANELREEIARLRGIQARQRSKPSGRRRHSGRERSVTLSARSIPSRRNSTSSKARRSACAAPSPTRSPSVSARGPWRRLRAPSGACRRSCAR